MNRNYKQYPITLALMIMVIVIYLYSFIKYGVEMNSYQGVLMGGFNPLLVLEYHEYYRLITANFIHFGLLHLSCNVFSLYNLGSLMERILKTKKYLIVMVASMLSSTLLPLLMFYLFNSGAYVIMGGISGAIFGLIGSLLALAYLYRDVYLYLFKQIAPSVILMLMISVLVPSISLWGHLGGMIGGFLFTLFLEKHQQNKIIN